MGNTASTSTRESQPSWRRHSSRLAARRSTTADASQGSTHTPTAIQSSALADAQKGKARAPDADLSGTPPHLARDLPERKVGVKRLRHCLSGLAKPFKPETKTRHSKRARRKLGEGSLVTAHTVAQPEDNHVVPANQLPMSNTVRDVSGLIGEDGLLMVPTAADECEFVPSTISTRGPSRQTVPVSSVITDATSPPDGDVSISLLGDRSRSSLVPSSCGSVYSEPTPQAEPATAAVAPHASGSHTSPDSQSAASWIRHDGTPVPRRQAPTLRSRSFTAQEDLALPSARSDLLASRRSRSLSRPRSQPEALRSRNFDSSQGRAAALVHGSTSTFDSPRYLLRSSSQRRQRSPIARPGTPRDMPSIRDDISYRARQSILPTSAARPQTLRSHSSPTTSQRPIPVRAAQSAGEIRRSRTPRQGEVVSALPGEDQAGMLSRLLSVAAAATAASLVGRDNAALRGGQDLAAQHAPVPLNNAGLASTAPATHATATQAPSSTNTSSQSDLVDGSFDGFLAALQSGQLAQALRNGGNILGGGNREEGSQQPLNFFRMFRFNSAVSINGAPAPAEGEERMVPIIIVGIRSVLPREEGANGEPPVPPFFETLGAMQTPPAYRPPATRAQSQTAEAEGAADSSATLASRTATVDSGEADVTMADDVEASLGTLVSASALESNTHPSARATPTEERPRLLNSVMDRLRSFGNDSSPAETTHEAPVRSSQAGETRPRRSRRPQWRPFATDSNSQSDVRPEPSSQDNPGNGQTRSWIIYVLGGTYPENHPLLTTPSLFTDSPTYEDMMLLGSLIGPAKPETAAQDDIESAGPTIELDETSSELEERCLICLSEFEAGDTVRTLSKCSHLYHRECIDTWLTTGRNTCPLCRSATEAKNAPMAGAGAPGAADVLAPAEVPADVDAPPIEVEA